ncbi:hypothetical protein [Streptomyces sp. NPDC019890]|uniref:hypothetical protein n=1 Tax=Streptomyces sp. NPDC019890 TaxID=3365064 RepID=UPI00384E5AD2
MSGDGGAGGHGQDVGIAPRPEAQKQAARRGSGGDRGRDEGWNAGDGPIGAQGRDRRGVRDRDGERDGDRDRGRDGNRDRDGAPYGSRGDHHGEADRGHRDRDGEDAREQDHEGTDADRDSRDRDTDDQSREREERDERERQSERFREAMHGPLGDDVAGGERAKNRAREEARTRFDVRGYNSVVDRSDIAQAHFGDVYIGAHETGSPVFGAIPADEMARLRRVYRPPQEYQALRDALRHRRVLVLGGPEGSGRTTTGLCLLDELTGRQARTAAGGGQEEQQDKVSRLDPSALTRIVNDPQSVVDGMPRGGGFLLRLPEAPGGWAVPEELHLDALAAASQKRDVYAVFVVSSASPGGSLLTGRYGRNCPPAPARELLSAQLTYRLSDQDDGASALTRAELILGHPLFQKALGVGVDSLTPAETEFVADLLCRHVAGRINRRQLLDGCARVADRQAHEWFTGTSSLLCGIAPSTADTAAGDAQGPLREAAFRIALAVLDGEAFSAVADAADQLAWELLVARDPDRAHGRPVLAENLPGLLASCRAEIGQGDDESLGGVPVPVRTVAYRGRALAGAVLAEVWRNHHAARAPVVRWLRTLAEDPRPQVWMRAAVAAGELCTVDMGYGFVELIRPLGSAPSLRRRYFTASALDQAGRREPFRSAVRSVVDEWADADSHGLRWTAALAIGYGRMTDDTASAVDLLGALGTRDEGEQLQVCSYSLARLAAGSRAAEVLAALMVWVNGGTVDHRDLALLAGVRLFLAHTADLWEREGTDGADPDSVQDDGTPGAGRSRGNAPHGADPAVTDAELERRSQWPLGLALVTAVPEAAGSLAALLWWTLDSHLSGEAAQKALRGWLRAAEEDARVSSGGTRTYAFQASADAGPEELERAGPDAPGQILSALLWFLPGLIRGERDWQRLEWLLRTMAEDPSEPATAVFGGHVLDQVGAGLRSRREGEQ